MATKIEGLDCRAIKSFLFAASLRRPLVLMMDGISGNSGTTISSSDTLKQGAEVTHGCSDHVAHVCRAKTRSKAFVNNDTISRNTIP